MLWSTLQAKFRALELLESKDGGISEMNKRTSEHLNQMKKLSKVGQKNSISERLDNVDKQFEEEKFEDIPLFSK